MHLYVSIQHLSKDGSLECIVGVQTSKHLSQLLILALVPLHILRLVVPTNLVLLTAG